MVKKQKAAISLFLIIVLIANITFGGLFIDLSRILVAKNRVRTATESAVRSSLAGYNADLVSEWGLFGVTENEVNDSFERYVRLNLDTDNNDGSLGILNYDLVSTQISVDKPLSNSDVFTEKINEYEKYRAPVSLTLGVIDKFKAIFGDKNALDSLEGLDVSNMINNSIDNMTSSYSNLSSITTNFNSEVDNSGAGLNNSSTGKLSEIDMDALDTLQSNIDSSIESSKGKVDSYKQSIKDYQSDGDVVDSAADSVKNKVNTSGVNGEIDDTPEGEESDWIEEGINTYESNIELNNGIYTDEAGNTTDFDQIQQQENDDALNRYNNEEALIDQTNNSADEANRKADELKITMSNKVAEARNLANIYNQAKNEFNSAYDSLTASVVSTCGSGYNADTVMNKYPDSAAIDAARQRIKDIDDELASCRSELAGLDYRPVDSELQQKKKYLNDLLKEEAELNRVFNDDLYANEYQVIAMVYETEDYENIKAIFEEYVAAHPDEENSLQDLMSAFDDRCNEVSNEINTGTKNNERAAQLSEKISELEQKQQGADYKLDKFAVNNSSAIFNAINKKNDAVQKGQIYNNKLAEIKQINTKEAMGADSITNFPELALDNSGVSEDEDDDFDSSGLFGIVDKVEGLILDMSATMPSADEVQESDLDSKSNGKVFGMFQNLLDYFNELGEVISNPGDKFYFVDYVMNKCTYLTSQTNRNHFFKYGEVEYIIFGKSSQIENILAAVGSITLMRFAINAINYWIKTPGELISRTVSAVLCGLAQTVADMTTMLLDTGTGSDKGLIAICPSLSKYKVLSYSDHLRILLLLKMTDDGGAGALRRCIHATQKDVYKDEDIEEIFDSNNNAWPSDVYLGQYYTEVTGKVEADVDLFFIPLFLPEFVNFGSIHDGKYRVSSSITFGY